MGSPGWQSIVFPLSELSRPPLFVSSPSISPGRHSISSQVAYLLVKQSSVPSAALQPELTVDWLVASHSSPLIMLKRSCSVRPKIHLPGASERRGGERRGQTKRDKREWDTFLIEVQAVCLCTHLCMCLEPLS